MSQNQDSTSELCQICNTNTPDDGRVVCGQCMSLPQYSHHCPQHGPHNGIKLGNIHTDKCPQCVIETRSASIRRAYARKRAKSQALPGGTNSEHTVLVDFSNCTWLLDLLKDRAQDMDISAFIRTRLFSQFPPEELLVALKHSCE